MGVIESDEYRQEEERLKADPIVIAMAKEIPKHLREVMVHPDGGAKFELMMRSNDEYRKRGGQGSQSIGGVARALIALWKQE